MFRMNLRSPIVIVLGFIFLTVGPLFDSMAADGKKHPVLDPYAIERLKSDTGGRSVVTVSGATGSVRFVRFNSGTKGDLMRSSKAATAAENSAAFFKQYGSMFGIKNPSAELKLNSEKSDSLKGKHLTFFQYYFGVPVFAGILKTHFDEKGELIAVNGNFIPEINLDVRPTKSAAEAATIAISLIKMEHPINTPLSAKNSTLYVYRTGLGQGVDGESYLVWQVEVGNGSSIRDFLFIDAHSGNWSTVCPGLWML